MGGGYYDPQGYDALGGSSSSERYDTTVHNGESNHFYPVGESNHFYPVGTANGGNSEQDAAAVSHAPQMGMLGAEQGVGNSSSSNNNNNPYDYSGYSDYMQAAHQQRAAAASNNYGGAYQGNGVSLQELDYCDLLLRGLDNSTAAAAQPNSNVPNNMDTNQILQNQLMWNTIGGGNPSMWSQAASATNQAPTKPLRSNGVSNSKPNMGHLDYFTNKQQQQPYSSASTADNAAIKSNPTSSTSHYHLKPPRKVKSLPHQVTTSTPSSSVYLPHSNSSQPENQIDPLLETLSLSVPSVSLQKLTGNEVIMHIRSKTDDVITRFLPCVDFLVNCQQELRQGLAIANQRKYVTTGRSRSSMANMTPSQFYARFVAPLPKKFERKNDYLMAREHLVPAKLQLDVLVKDAQNSIPQGCEHVKNTFLGGMRENESWGLRKWLSKHGGAGSICNDLEEVLRTVKALKKDNKTTIKLAEQLRPIASQAHDRLKKDVPQAYQEQSSAHPYLPFFHRLEACLKQMANYDPEDDDVICLDSDQEDDDVVEVVKSIDKSDKKTTDVPKSSAVKKRILHKREREEDDCNNEASSVALPACKRGKSLENIGISLARIEKTDCNGKQQEVICLDDSSDEDEEDDDDEQFKSQLLTLEGGIESPSQTPIPETDEPNNLEMDRVKDGGWRCQHCTYPNAPNALKCIMCNDDDSAAGNETDDLATFLGSGIMDDSNHGDG